MFRLSKSLSYGRNTTFWHDRWLTDTPMAAMMPALHSHFTGRATSVHDVVSAALRGQFQRRLTTQVVAKLDQLTEMLQDVTLSTENDDRASFFEDGDHRLLAGLIYKASARGDHQCASYNFVWCNFAPPRVKFFGWLLTQNGIHCRMALVHNNILDDARCELCSPLLLFCWEIWKHTNEVVFRGMAPDISLLRAACKESIKAWCCCIPRKDESLARQWSNVMSM